MGRNLLRLSNVLAFLAVITDPEKHSIREEKLIIQAQSHGSSCAAAVRNRNWTPGFAHFSVESKTSACGLVSPTVKVGFLSQPNLGNSSQACPEVILSWQLSPSQLYLLSPGQLTTSLLSHVFPPTGLIGSWQSHNIKCIRPNFKSHHSLSRSTLFKSVSDEPLLKSL